MNPYLAYLIRLWRVETEHGTVWRAALEDAYSAEQHSFADLNGLVTFLVEKTGATVAAPALPRDSLQEEHSND